MDTREYNEPSPENIAADIAAWRDVDDWQTAITFMCRFLRGDGLVATPWHFGPLDRETEPLIKGLLEIQSYGALTICSQPHESWVESPRKHGRRWRQIQQRGFVQFLLPAGHSGLTDETLTAFLECVRRRPNIDVCVGKDGTELAETPAQSVTLARRKKASIEAELEQSEFTDIDHMTLDPMIAMEMIDTLQKCTGLTESGYYYVMAYAKDWDAPAAFLDDIVVALQESGATRRFETDRAQSANDSLEGGPKMYAYFAETLPRPARDSEDLEFPPVLFTSRQMHTIGNAANNESAAADARVITLCTELHDGGHATRYVSVHRGKIHISEDEDDMIRQLQSHRSSYSCLECAMYAVHEIDCFEIPVEEGVVLSFGNAQQGRRKICIKVKAHFLHPHHRKHNSEALHEKPYTIFFKIDPSIRRINMDLSGEKIKVNNLRSSKEYFPLDKHDFAVLKFEDADAASLEFIDSEDEETMKDQYI
ncbi:Hypothetical protein D9617_44g038900 [Elsinoe fawcettii]|nr:Hypothetical protein D9617_44g038900 [Elsinoe fawcettii]